MPSTCTDLILRLSTRKCSQITHGHSSQIFGNFSSPPTRRRTQTSPEHGHLALQTACLNVTCWARRAGEDANYGN